MTPASPSLKPWASEPTGPWYRWRGYAVRWLLFGLLVSVLQPVTEQSTSPWQEKGAQALAGLLFGAACAVVFTLAENRFNTPRRAWKSWLIVLATWLLVKVLFVSTLAQLS